MVINKDAMIEELEALLGRVFLLPEVNKVQIRDNQIFSVKEKDKIIKSVEDSYHDVLSDIDVGIHVTLHSDDIGEGHGYHTNPARIGLSRENYLGIAFSDGGGIFQMYRVIMKNGIRFDIGFYITEDNNTPIYHIPLKKTEEMKDSGKYWARWDLRKADEFWFVEIQATAKLFRGDYLIADHLANILINETLLAQMVERDNCHGTRFHRYGYHEILDYKTVELLECPLKKSDESFNLIAGKLYAAAVSYDRLIKNLNPDYEERRSILLEIWKQYEIGIKY